MTENEQRLQRLLSGISPLYEAPMREAKARQDALALVLKHIHLSPIV